MVNQTAVTKRINAIALWVILVCTMPQTAWAAEKIIVRVSDFAPYYFQNKAGTWTGMSIDIVNAVAKEANYDTVFIRIPRKRAFQNIKQGKIDLMLNLTQTAEREKFLDFIGISSYEQMVLIVKKENKNIQVETLKDLANFQKQFGLQEKYYYPNLTEKLNDDPEFKQYFDYIATNAELNLRKTLGGRIMGFFEDKAFALYSVKTNPKYRGLIVHSFSLNSPQPVFIAASKKLDLTKRNRLRMAHQKLSKQGVIPGIIKLWSK